MGKATDDRQIEKRDELAAGSKTVRAEGFHCFLASEVERFQSS